MLHDKTYWTNGNRGVIYTANLHFPDNGMHARAVKKVTEHTRTNTLILSHSLLLPHSLPPQIMHTQTLNRCKFVKKELQTNHKSHVYIFMSGIPTTRMQPQACNVYNIEALQVAVKELLHEKLIKPGRVVCGDALAKEEQWLRLVNQHGLGYLLKSNAYIHARATRHPHPHPHSHPHTPLACVCQQYRSNIYAI
jgi:hypothetical protein